jgi:WD40 repeat protein
VKTDLVSDPDAAYNPPSTLLREQKGVVYSCIWSPASSDDTDTRLASASADGTVQIMGIVWSEWSNEGEPVSTKKVLTYTGHTAAVYAIAWSPDGMYLASADESFQVWDAQTGKTVVRHKQSGRSYAIAWFPDGTRVASGGTQYTVEVWDPKNGHHIAAWSGHTGAISSLIWSPDGTLLMLPHTFRATRSHFTTISRAV